MGDKFNIACGESYSVNEVYEAIRDLIGKPVSKHNVPPRLGDPRKSQADISKAMRELDYHPRVKFQEGMKKTAEWYLENSDWARTLAL